MDKEKNIFDQIVAKMPDPNPEDVKKLQQLEAEQKPPAPNTPFQQLPLKDMVSAWQKDPSPDNTRTVLEQLRPTIRSAMNSYAKGMDSELEISAARLALDTLKTYDPTKGAEPTTYVFHNLKRLNRLAADRSGIIHYPEQALADVAKIRKYMADFEDDTGREPSIGEIADALGMNTRKVDKLLGMGGVTNESAMMVPETGDLMGGGAGLSDLDYFEYVYASVGPIDQKIMEWTSGLHGKPTLSNNDIAARLHISPAAVSQRKARIQSLMSDVRGLV